MDVRIDISDTLYCVISGMYQVKIFSFLGPSTGVSWGILYFQNIYIAGTSETQNGSITETKKI